MSDTSATSLISLIRHIADMDIQMAGADSQVIHIDPPHTDERVGHIRPVLPLSDYSFFKLNTEISNVFIQAGYCVPTWCIELPKMSGPDFTLCIKDIFDLNTGTWQNIKQCSDQLFNLLEQMSLISLIRVQQVGIFVNLIVSDTYIQQVLNHILDTDDRYGSCDILLGQSAIVEYSSPNMGKQMGIGHLRSTIIGQIIANTMMALGSRILKRNYLGDRGTPFGKLIYSLIYHYQIEGSQLVDQIITAPTEMMLRLYASFSTLPAEDKLEKAKLYFMRLEQGCDPVVKLWHILRSATLVDFQYIYDQFQISFDITHGESFTQQYLSEIENDLTQAGYMTPSQGAWIVRFEKIQDHGQEIFVPLKATDQVDEVNKSYEVTLIRKSDGSTLYATRDLALMKYKASLGYQHLYNIVGAEQTLHFKLVASLAQALGYLSDSCDFTHISFGMYLQDGSKMATRKGNIWRLGELIITISQQIIQQFESKTVPSQVSTQLAISALIFQDIKNDRIKDINFDINAMTKLNGDTGIYLNYTLVRLQALITKLSTDTQIDAQIDHTSYTDSEHKLLVRLSVLPLILIQSHYHLKPHLIAQYVLDIVADINHWYSTSEKILDLATAQQAQKKHIAQAFMIGLSNVMHILHLPTVNHM